MLKNLHPLALASIAATVAVSVGNYYLDHGHVATAVLFLAAHAILTAFLPNRKP